MKGIAIINAYGKMKQSFMQAKRLQTEFFNLGVSLEIICNDKFLAYIQNGDIAINGIETDFVIYLDKDLYMAKMLQDKGFKLFNSAKAIEVCDDKMLTHIMLAGQNIHMPTTLSGLLCYQNEEKISPEVAKKICKIMGGFPIIVKENKGSWGNQVHKVDDMTQLEDIMQNVKCKPHLYQKFIASSYGKDIRVLLIGGKVVACMQRNSLTDFRSNIEKGGIGSYFDLPTSFREISEKVAKILELDYCGIDLLVGELGEPILCEVNSNAFFDTLESVSGINIAKAYASYIISKTQDILL